MCCPKIDVVVRLGPQYLLDDETLPGRSKFGMTQESFGRIDAEKVVQQAGVSDIHLGRFDLAFAQIGMPGP